jgi:hypothetical protein
VPERLLGTALYPLNELAGRAHEAWLRERAKYDGRERVLEQRLPLLDCLWNDVLHLSPVHPGELAEALEAAGLELERRRFFEVDAARLDPGRTLVFLNSTDREHRFDDGQWSWFEPGLVSPLTRLPEATRAYYAQCARAGASPRLFAYVPHVLFRGSLDVTGLRVVEV